MSPVSALLVEPIAQPSIDNEGLPRDSPALRAAEKQAYISDFIWLYKQLCRNPIYLLPVLSKDLQRVGFDDSGANSVHADLFVAQTLRQISDCRFHGGFHASERISRVIKTTPKTGDKDNFTR